MLTIEARFLFEKLFTDGNKTKKKYPHRSKTHTFFAWVWSGCCKFVILHFSYRLGAQFGYHKPGYNT